MYFYMLVVEERWDVLYISCVDSEEIERRWVSIYLPSFDPTAVKLGKLRGNFSFDVQVEAQQKCLIRSIELYCYINSRSRKDFEMQLTTNLEAQELVVSDQTFAAAHSLYQTYLRTISLLYPVDLSPPPRSKTTRMPSPPHPNLVPYRDTNNQTVAYVPASNLPNNNPIPITSYDSDFEPLISGAPAAEELDEDSLMRFTATGRPIPGFKVSGLQSMGGDMHSQPQLLPKRYTDDSIIPAIVVDVIPSQKLVEEEERNKGRRGSFLKKFKGDTKKDETKGVTKVVYMPRRDYLKYFARDLEGKYIGSEPYKRWEQEELEETFKQYKPVVEKKRGYRAPY